MIGRGDEDGGLIDWLLDEGTDRVDGVGGSGRVRCIQASRPPRRLFRAKRGGDEAGRQSLDSGVAFPFELRTSTGNAPRSAITRLTLTHSGSVQRGYQYGITMQG